MTADPMTHPSPEAVERAMKCAETLERSFSSEDMTRGEQSAITLRAHVTALTDQLAVEQKRRQDIDFAFVTCANDKAALTAQLEAERVKVAELTSKMVNCGDVTVNRDHVISFGWDRRHYMNGSHSWFVVKTVAGDEIRIEYRPQGYGPDPYKIEKELRGA